MTATHVRTTTTGAVARVVLDRPEALNALTPALLHELGAALRALAADDAVRVVVLTGEGRAFSAGVDLKVLATLPLDGGAVGDLLDVPARRVIDAITSMPKVVIAAVNGHCFTGALELALACDLLVAAEEAVFGDTHARFGLRPTWGMSQRLVRAVGITRARALSYTARTFTGAEAAAWGLAVEAVPRAELDDAVTRWADAIAANSPGALAAYKQLYARALDAGLADGLAYEAATAFAITDTEERVASFR
jgi:enoyl-CoA hydratase/carnithine racemase